MNLLFDSEQLGDGEHFYSEKKIHYHQAQL